MATTGVLTLVKALNSEAHKTFQEVEPVVSLLATLQSLVVILETVASCEGDASHAPSAIRSSRDTLADIAKGRTPFANAFGHGHFGIHVMKSINALLASSSVDELAGSRLKAVQVQLAQLVQTGPDFQTLRNYLVEVDSAVQGCTVSALESFRDIAVSCFKDIASALGQWSETILEPMATDEFVQLIADAMAQVSIITFEFVKDEEGKSEKVCLDKVDSLMLVVNDVSPKMVPQLAALKKTIEVAKNVEDRLADTFTKAKVNVGLKHVAPLSIMASVEYLLRCLLQVFKGFESIPEFYEAYYMEHLRLWEAWKLKATAGGQGATSCVEDASVRLPFLEVLLQATRNAGRFEEPLCCSLEGTPVSSMFLPLV